MTDSGSSFTKQEVKAGLMVLFSVACFAGLALIVAGYRPALTGDVYYAYFPDTGGLNRGASVRFGGARVGRVTSIELSPEHRTLIRVGLAVSENVPINAGSEAFITQTSLTADHHVEITTGTETARLLEPGDVIPARPGGLFDRMDLMAGSITRVMEDLRVLMGVSPPPGPVAPDAPEAVTITQLFDRLDTTLDAGGVLITDIQEAVGEARPAVEELTRRLEAMEAKASALMDAMTGAIEGNQPAIERLLARFEEAALEASTVAARLRTVADTADDTLRQAGAASGSAQQLLETNRDMLEDALRDMRDTARHLRDFSETISEQPHSLVRGRQPQGRVVE